MIIYVRAEGGARARPRRLNKQLYTTYYTIYYTTLHYSTIHYHTITLLHWILYTMCYIIRYMLYYRGELALGVDDYVFASLMLYADAPVKTIKKYIHKNYMIINT